MKSPVILGADHAGFELKSSLVKWLRQSGHAVIDVGTYNTRRVDYPDYAEKLSLEVLSRNGARGILICGSGVGASIAANKIPGIRAALCHDCYSAHQGVEHDQMNVLVLGSRVISEQLARDLVAQFLQAQFMSNVLRYRRRLKKVQALETRYCEAPPRPLRAIGQETRR